MAVSTAAMFWFIVAIFCLSPANSAVTPEGQINLPGEKTPTVKEDVSWPGFPHLKQVSAVFVDGDGNLHIFHRGDRIWGINTFDHTNHLVDTDQGPIPNDTVLVIDTTNGKTLYSWGANRFYMPHGLTVDRHGNTWVTDVGLHQVFMFPARESSPDLMLGDPFVPGAGRYHLCKPTDVAVTSRHFFVGDGYCNSRVLMFSMGGRLLREIGAKDGMIIPHSLALVPEHDALCVADRERGRVLCYATGMDGSVPGTPLAIIENHGLGRVFAIDTRGKQLFLVNGPDLTTSQSVSADHGLVLNIESGLPMTMWGPDQGFNEPHDLALSPDGKYAYVAEIDVNAPKRVYKFNIRD